MDEEHGGAGLPWLAKQIQDTCIDGELLLQLTDEQLSRTLMLGRPAGDRQIIKDVSVTKCRSCEHVHRHNRVVSV